MTGVRVEWCNFWSKAYALDLNHPHSVLIYFISNTSCHSIVKKLFWRGLFIVESYLSKNESSAASYRRQHWIHLFRVKILLIPDRSCQDEAGMTELWWNERLVMSSILPDIFITLIPGSSLSFWDISRWLFCHLMVIQIQNEPRMNGMLFKWPFSHPLMMFNDWSEGGMM